MTRPRNSLPVAPCVGWKPAPVTSRQADGRRRLCALGTCIWHLLCQIRARGHRNSHWRSSRARFQARYFCSLCDGEQLEREKRCGRGKWRAPDRASRRLFVLSELEFAGERVTASATLGPPYRARPPAFAHSWTLQRATPLPGPATTRCHGAITVLSRCCHDAVTALVQCSSQGRLEVSLSAWRVAPKARRSGPYRSTLLEPANPLSLHSLQIEAVSSVGVPAEEEPCDSQTQ